MGTGKELWHQFETLFNKRDWAGVASLYTSDGVYSTPNFRHEGPERIRAFCENMGSAVSDINIEDIVGDRGERSGRGRVDVPAHPHRIDHHARRYGDNGNRQDGGASRRDDKSGSGTGSSPACGNTSTALSGCGNSG